jgi:DNA mismatch repair ATPase MutS
MPLNSRRYSGPMETEPRNRYRRKADSANLEIRGIRKKMNLISLVRLVLFAGALFLFFGWYKAHLAFAAAASLASLVMFLVFVRLGSGLTVKRRLLSELVAINEEEIRALDRDFSAFNPGTEFSDPGHPYASDLDVFGENSLFQYLNRTGISSGREQLAVWLRGESPWDEIVSRQLAVEELALKLDWRQVFLATGRMSGEKQEDFIRLKEWLSEEPMLIRNRLYRILLWSLPSLTILATVLAFFWIPYNIPAFLVIIQLGIVGLNLRRINHHHNQISRKFNLIDKYSSLIGMIENESFRSEYLEQLRAGLSSRYGSAGKQLRSLARILLRFDRRLNMVMGVILNAFLLWDLQCMLRLEQWKKANALRVPGWFSVLGKYEALNSFAGFRFNQPDSVYPEPGDGRVILHAEALGHPLIPTEENVRNDLKIGKPGEFMLITGSNMAGKSTFLRTVGVNLVLAGAGAPVIAEHMTWMPVKLLTSMRIWDSLSNRESTFYAELKRLRMILEELKKGEPVMVLLDEILTGTKSRDKHFGSEMFIRQLIREGGSGLVATHDLELGKLEEEFPDNVLNYSFEVQIEKQEFSYDYKLRRGVCSTLNATELMKKMGISLNPED